jgi:P-type conjugative transfer protein TrbJ
MKRSHIVIVAATIAGGVSVVRPAQAQWVVSDPTNLIQNTSTALSTAKTVLWTYQQVKQMQSQIGNQLQSLKSLDPRSFDSLMALIDQGKLTYAMIRSDVDSLGFSVKEINQGFDGLFPRDKSKWKNVRYSDYDNYYTRWNTEITASSKAAERAQANLVIVERNNQQIADILKQAQSANGEVRQLQLINQQLGLIHQELGTLVQNLTTAGRVNANMAASAASEKMLQREAAQRRRDGYTSLGRPAQALKRLP